MSRVRNDLPSRRCFHSGSMHERADEDVSRREPWFSSTDLSRLMPVHGHRHQPLRELEKYKRGLAGREIDSLSTSSDTEST